MTTRRKYPQKFNLDAVNLVLEQEYTKAEIRTIISGLIRCEMDLFKIKFRSNNE